MSVVLDASALLAYLVDEPGAETVTAAIEHGASISVVNLAEVLSKLAERGDDPEATCRELTTRGLLGGLIQVAPLELADAVEVARLRPLTQAAGLGLGDRACLALGVRSARSVLTADRDWSALTIGGLTVRPIR